MVVGARRIRSEKLREDQYREEYARSLEGKRVKGDRDNNVEHMWEQVKWAMVESAREVCCLIRVEGKNPKSVWWNDKVKAAGRRKEAGWKDMLTANNKKGKERCMEKYRKEKRKV